MSIIFPLRDVGAVAASSGVKEGCPRRHVRDDVLGKDILTTQLNTLAMPLG
jgi:hypothetical protein